MKIFSTEDNSNERLEQLRQEIEKKKLIKKKNILELENVENTLIQVDSSLKEKRNKIHELTFKLEMLLKEKEMVDMKLNSVMVGKDKRFNDGEKETGGKTCGGACNCLIF